MSWGAIVVGGIGAVGSMISAKGNKETAEQIAEDAKIERDKQQAALDVQKQQYEAQRFENPFADMENVYEDLTVNQQQAQFQAQQGAQQRSNVLESMRGAAGGSGIAGLAQAMANQGQLQTQQISASIGQQEAMNQRLRAQGADRIQTLGRQGEQFVQQSEMNRQATLLGMQMGEATGANVAFQQAQANQMSAGVAQDSATANLFGALAPAAGALTGAIGSAIGGGGGGAGVMPTTPIPTVGAKQIPVELKDDIILPKNP